MAQRQVDPGEFQGNMVYIESSRAARESLSQNNLNHEVIPVECSYRTVGAMFFQTGLLSPGPGQVRAQLVVSVLRLSLWWWSMSDTLFVS